ncbi:MAG: hypothetical protein QXO97_05500 [Candidatus Nezhaarchaeales archaeon]
MEVELAESHADACKQSLRKVMDGFIKSAITDSHVDSIVIVVENYGKSWKNMATFLASLLRYKGLVIYPRLERRIKSTTLMRGYGLDLTMPLRYKPSKIYLLQQRSLIMKVNPD